MREEVSLHLILDGPPWVEEEDPAQGPYKYERDPSDEDRGCPGDDALFCRERVDRALKERGDRHSEPVRGEQEEDPERVAPHILACIFTPEAFDTLHSPSSPNTPIF